MDACNLLRARRTEEEKDVDVSTHAQPLDPNTEETKIMRHVDVYYDNLRSARQALWETMCAHDELARLFNVPMAIGRITKKLAYVKLLRQARFHGWTTAEDIMKHVPYWEDMFASQQQLEEFIDSEDVDGFSNTPLKDVRRDKRAIQGILEARNRNPRTRPKNDSDLKRHIQNVVHDYLDRFDVEGAEQFLRKIYSTITSGGVAEPSELVPDLVSHGDEMDYMIQRTTRVMELLESKQDNMNLDELKNALPPASEKKEGQQRRRRRRRGGRGKR